MELVPSPPRSSGPLVAAVDVALGTGLPGPPIATGPLVAETVAVGSGEVVSVAVAVGTVGATATPENVGAAGAVTCATVGAGAAAGRKNTAMPAVTPDAQAAATMAMAIHGGAFRSRGTSGVARMAAAPGLIAETCCVAMAAAGPGMFANGSVTTAGSAWGRVRSSGASS